MDARSDSAAPASASTSVLNWLSVIGVAFATFVMVTTEFLPIGLLSRIAGDLGVTDGTAGWMVTTPGVVAAIAAPAAAFGMRRIDRRWMLVGLTVLVLVSNLLAAASESFAIMLMARFLLGIAVGSFWAFAGAVGRRLVAERDGATATAIVLAGISIGTVLGLPLGAVIGSWIGWRAAFGIAALLSVLALLAQCLLLPALAPLPGARDPGPAARPGKLLVLAGLAFAFLLILGHFAAYTYLEPYLMHELHLGANFLGAALCAYGIAGLAGNFVGAHFADKQVLRTYRLVAALLALSIFALAATQATAIVGLAIIGWGMAFGALPACLQIWLYRAAPERFEASSALMVTVFQIALAAGSRIGGIAADEWGLHDTMIVAGAFAALGVLALLAYRAPVAGKASAIAVHVET